MHSWSTLILPALEIVAIAAFALSGVIDRDVRIGTTERPARLSFLHGLSLDAPSLQIGAPAWSDRPWMLQLRQGRLAIGYRELWAAARGGPITLQELSAQSLDAELQRQANGQASWQFGKAAPARPAPASAEPAIQVMRLTVDQGRVRYDDAMLDVHTQVAFSVVQVRATPANAPQWQVAALVEGRYRGMPLSAQAHSVEPWTLQGLLMRGGPPWSLVLRSQIGAAQASFDGRVAQPLLSGPIAGRFEVSGPSLGAAGVPLGLTLPTTAAFRLQGQIEQQGPLTHARIDEARIGRSRLQGDFHFRRDTQPPQLRGQLTGPTLVLADLAPAVGAGQAGATAMSASASASASSPDAAAPAPRPTAARQPARLLPDRPFNLPSLRVMDADVTTAIDRLDLGRAGLQALQRLRGHIVLKDGVLKLQDVSLGLGKGHLEGQLTLDGRQPQQAQLQAQARFQGLAIDQWAPVLHPAGRPPYLAGRLSGQLDVQGQGASTAALLGSLSGQGDLKLSDGQVSHLLIELAGLDLFQGAGEWLKGDDALPIDCAQLRWRARGGVVSPELAVLSTQDSTLWATGQVSLRDETLDLQARVAPKDFSLIALRATARLQGPWSSPDVKVFNASSWARLLGSAALFTVQPLAAVVPLVDPGQREQARQLDARCHG